MENRNYWIEVIGTHTEIWDERLENWSIVSSGSGVTRLVGFVRDEAQLYSVMTALHDMGLIFIGAGICSEQTGECK